MNKHFPDTDFMTGPVIPTDLLPIVQARASREGITVAAAYEAILEDSYAAQRKARERVEYENPYGYDGRGY